MMILNFLSRLAIKVNHMSHSGVTVTTHEAPQGGGLLGTYVLARLGSV